MSGEKYCSAYIQNKGEIKNCRNYRGIKLMSQTMQLWGE